MIFQFFKFELSEVSGTGDHALNTHFPMLLGISDFSFSSCLLPVLVIFKVTLFFLLPFSQCPVPSLLSFTQGHLIFSQSVYFSNWQTYVSNPNLSTHIPFASETLLVQKQDWLSTVTLNVDSSCQLTMIYLKPKSGNCSLSALLLIPLYNSLLFMSCVV